MNEQRESQWLQDCCLISVHIRVETLPCMWVTFHSWFFFFSVHYLTKSLEDLCEFAEHMFALKKEDYTQVK